MSTSFVFIALTVAGVAAIVGVTYWLRSAGRLNVGRYVVAVGVLGVLLAAFAIATAATGAWIWSLWAVAFLAALALVAYSAVRRHGEKGSSDADLR
jgi:O-antigen/teichoic acid export membrane protein